jgi:hypothetical protein
MTVNLGVVLGRLSQVLGPVLSVHMATASAMASKNKPRPTSREPARSGPGFIGGGVGPRLSETAGTLDESPGATGLRPLTDAGRRALSVERTPECSGVSGRQTFFHQNRYSGCKFCALTTRC